MKDTNYNIDFKKEIINITASFSERANIVNSKEYKELCQLRKDYRDFTFKYAPKVKANKETYKGLTNAFIDQYVKDHDDTVRYTAELNQAKELYKQLNNGRPATNPQLKKWFTSTFPHVTGAEIRDRIAHEEATIALLEELEKKVETANSKKVKFTKINSKNVVPLVIVSNE